MPTLLCSLQVAGPARADRAGVDDRRAGGAGELAVVGVADEEEQRLGAVAPASSSWRASGSSAGLWTITMSTSSRSGRSQVAKRSISAWSGLLEDVGEALARLALVGVVVAGDPDALDRSRSARRSSRPCPSSRPVRVRTIAPSRASRFASWSESWLPGTNTNGLPVWTTRLTSACLDRAAAVGQVAGEEDGALGGGPLEDRDRDDVVVEVRGEREARAVLERGAVAGGGDEAREADELRVELLVERPRAALRGLDRARARAGCRGRRRSTAACRSGRAAGGR